MLSSEGMQLRKTVKNNNRSNQQKQLFTCSTLSQVELTDALAFLILSPPLQNFHVVLRTKKCLLCSLSLALNPCRPFSLSFTGLPPTFSFSLSFSCSIFQIVGMTIYLSLILQTTRIQKQFPLSVFFFIDSFVVSAYKTPVTIHAISCQNNLELHLGYHTC